MLIPNLEMQKRRLRKVKQLAQAYRSVSVYGGIGAHLASLSSSGVTACRREGAGETRGMKGQPWGERSQWGREGSEGEHGVLRAEWTRQEV